MNEMDTESDPRRSTACSMHMSGEGALHLGGDRKNLLGNREHIYSRDCLLGKCGYTLLPSHCFRHRSANA